MISNIHSILPERVENPIPLGPTATSGEVITKLIMKGSVYILTIIVVRSSLLDQKSVYAINPPGTP